jgi:hypothetical protein
MNTTTTKIAGEAMTDERETFKEFRAALCRMSDANTPVSVADRVMILSNATFLMDEYARALPASPSDVPSCVHVNNPKGCYRVRCQLGNKCVDDDMSPRSVSTAPAQSCGDAEQADAPQAKTVPFVMCLDDVVEMWNSVIADSFEDELIEFAAKAINFYKDSLPGSAAQNVAEQADEAVTKDAARYRVIRLAAYNYGVSNPSPCELDAKLDAARAKDSK